MPRIFFEQVSVRLGKPERNSHKTTRVKTASTLAALWLGLSFSPSLQASPDVNTGIMTAPIAEHTATLLPDGMVLIADGHTNYHAGGGLPYAELFDPATRTWTNTGTPLFARVNHTATLLLNGKVLAAGGFVITNACELYDPSTRKWSLTGPSIYSRAQHSATLLTNGQVLVAGGTSTNPCELYNPATGTWTITGALNINHQWPASVLLPDGRVLIAGGANLSKTNTCELYDPLTGMWTITGGLNVIRGQNTATLLPNGLVLVTGGNLTNTSAELYDPASGQWRFTGSMHVARYSHSATLLPNGTVLVSGGPGTNVNNELYDPVTEQWTQLSPPLTTRLLGTATRLRSGEILFAGGYSYTTNNFIARALTNSEVYQPDPPAGSWAVTNIRMLAQHGHSATLLPTGQVLVAGGDNNGFNLAGSALYDSAAGTWQSSTPLNNPRSHHTATLLANGQVLVAGGDGAVNILSSAELYDPGAAAWTLTGPMKNARTGHTATLLPNGKILVVGGRNETNYLATAEIYDPIHGTWTMTGPLPFPVAFHTATLLTNGTVLLAGGFDGTFGNSVAYAEIYDPASGKWTFTGNMTGSFYRHTATLLSNGKVLVAGGNDINGQPNNSASLYDPNAGAWTAVSNLVPARVGHTATLLANGCVLFAGGQTLSNFSLTTVASAQWYNPVNGTWTSASALNAARDAQTATFLPNGKLLLAGGESNGAEVAGSELFDCSLAVSNYPPPQITALNSPLALGDALAVTGSQFLGFSEGSIGNSQSSAENFPLLQLRSIDSGQTLYLTTTNASDFSYNSAPVLGFPPGPALATIFASGIQSTSRIVNIGVPVPVGVNLAGPQIVADGSLQFTFTNNIGALFTVLASTNLALPLSNWTVVGGATENPPGSFRFVDPNAQNFLQRFYSIRSP